MAYRMFLDYCVLNDALRDATVLAKLRFLAKEGTELCTGTTVLGEAIELLSEGPREGQYMLVDLIRDLGLKYLHPRKEWLKAQSDLDRILEGAGANYVPSSERAHMSLAIANGIEAYVTSRPEARTLSQIKGLEKMVLVIDIDKAVEKVRSVK